MHCLARKVRPHQRHSFPLSTYCSGVHPVASNSASRLSPSISPFVRLTCIQSPPICTCLHSNAHSFHHFCCGRPGVNFMNSGTDFSINPFSTAAETTASGDANNANTEERLDSSRGIELEPESGNSFSSEAAAGGEARVGSSVSEREESSIADDEGWTGPTESSVKRVLLEDLGSNVMKLTCESTASDGPGVCNVYLVGTAHVSSESCRLVESVISSLQPQVVFLELCSSRVNILQPQNLKVPTVGEMMNMWKKNHNIFGILYSRFLAQVASRLEVLPGAEFRVAYEEAMKYGGKIILGDRPVQITLQRTWSKMPLWHKIKLSSALLFQAFSLPNPEDLSKMLKDMDNNDMLTLVIQEMSKQFPTLMETLVDERDRYISSTLLKVACEHNSVVAVVGKGHLSGIKKYWKQPVEIKALVRMPRKRSAFCVRKILTTVGVAVAVGGVAIVSKVYLGTKK